MNLKNYLATLERGGNAAFAKRLQISQSFLSQMASGLSSISPTRAVAIEAASAGAVTRQELRPDDYFLIWPDLPKQDIQSEEA